MEPHKFLDPNLTPQDRLVLENLLRDADVDNPKASPSTTQNGKDNNTSKQNGTTEPNAQDQQEASLINHLESMNDPKSPQFDPTIFVTWDTPTVESSVPAFVTNYLIRPYTNLARRLVRVETDVVMLTHLLIYFSTSVPSALYLYLGNFTWTHGILHWAMQTYYVGTFTLMMHQHIHMGGILSRRLAWLDTLFPYLLYPLMGHTWNSYYYHHVKHHHIEGNGPDDISSTIFYQRDSPRDLACYVGRFLFLVWFELPTYFVKRGRAWSALKAAFWELGSYALMAGLYRVNPRATVFVLILPFVQLRLGLMVGNWGQHAFVDEVDPDSDFRSSTTLVDVASNRFCYNDGYHTSHHLNPKRHWRDHPLAFMKQKHRYATEHALVFRNIDYIMVTLKLMQKDYMYLAKCLVPMGEQIPLTLEERAEMLKTKTRRFTREEVEEKYRGK